MAYEFSMPQNSSQAPVYEVISVPSLSTNATPPEPWRVVAVESSLRSACRSDDVSKSAHFLQPTVLLVRLLAGRFHLRGAGDTGVHFLFLGRGRICSPVDFLPQLLS
jgi:hypothetical protein